MGNLRIAGNLPPFACIHFIIVFIQFSEHLRARSGTLVVLLLTLPPVRQS
jgi:hypothetical protein